MPLSDPAHRLGLHHGPAEAPEELALRAELRELLGLESGPLPVVSAAPSPELVELAEDLRREAERRRRTYPFKPRASWQMAAAAALPFVLGLAGAGFWGLQQKHRADDLAQAVVQKESEVQRVSQQAVASQAELARERATREEVQQQLVLATVKLGRKPSYLVVPAQKPLGPETTETLRVKANR